jgi:hypothetical protein
VLSAPMYFCIGSQRSLINVARVMIPIPLLTFPLVGVDIGW